MTFFYSSGADWGFNALFYGSIISSIASDLQMSNLIGCNRPREISASYDIGNDPFNIIVQPMDIQTTLSTPPNIRKYPDANNQMLINGANDLDPVARVQWAK
jgi:hypothetical protein